MNRILWAGITALVAIGIFIAWDNRAQNNFRCPNDYATAEEYIEGLTEWAQGELLNSPNMTKEELLNERGRLFKEHTCESSRWPDLPAGL